MKKLAILAAFLYLAGCGGGSGNPSSNVGALAGSYSGEYRNLAGNRLGTANLTISANGATHGQTADDSNGSTGHFDGQTTSAGNFSGTVNMGGNNTTATGFATTHAGGIDFTFSFTVGNQTFAYAINGTRQ